tara:strand:- start:143410 stop:143964 length:555 start_codon:yes stop_codon:yes gene_type:complete
MSKIDLNNLHSQYRLKRELITYCQQHKLSTQGSKTELIHRIDIYLKTGEKQASKKIVKSTRRDSAQHITKQTPVINYNNDAKTREFFVAELGNNFKFNRYLRQFTDATNIQTGMTYGDLIKGWKNAEASKHKQKPNIEKQFEYNQFIQDFFTHEKGATLQQAIAAWKIAKQQSGEHRYQPRSTT